MSTLLSRVTDLAGGASRQAEDAPPRPGWQAALLAAAGAAAGVLVALEALVLLSWVAADTASGATDALAGGAYGWLLAHGVPLTVDAGAAGSWSVSLHPLGLTLVTTMALCAAGKWAVRASEVSSVRAVLTVVGQLSVAYGALLAGVAVLTGSGPAQPNVVVAGLAGVLIAAVTAGAGAIRAAGLAAVLRARAPLFVRVSLDAGTGALLVLLAGSSLVLAASLIVHFSRVVGLTGSVAPGVTGWPLLLVLNLALIPNAAVYALSFAVGPGFALGAGTSVALGGTTAGPVPALGLLGAVPDGAAAAPYAYAVLLLPVAAGVVAGLLAVARSPGVTAERAAGYALSAGAVVGVLCGALAWSAGGAIGDGQLAGLGPSPWLVALVVAVEVGVVGAVAAWVACPRPSAAAVTAEASRTRAGTVASRAIPVAAAATDAPTMSASAAAESPAARAVHD